MKDHASRAALVAALIAAGTVALAGTTTAAAAADTTVSPTVSPTDPRLVPNPVESSDEGTSWTCRAAGPDITCDGDLAYGWSAEPGPDDWCAQPLWSVDGRFHRTQARWYSLDPASGQYLEYFRLVHVDISDALVASPDAPASLGVQTRLLMTWRSDFGTPGVLDSRVTRKQGIDTWFKTARGGVFTLDVGQKTTILSDDFDLRGRWDIAAGDPGVEFGKVCTALGL